MSSRASSAVRLRVFVGGRTPRRWRFIQGPMRSSESPYRDAVSMWLTPYRSSNSRVRSASVWLARARAAPPNSVTVLRWPVRPNGRRSIIAPRRISLTSGDRGDGSALGVTTELGNVAGMADLLDHQAMAPILRAPLH